MKVTEQGNYLIISSYPFRLAWLCLIIIFCSLYAGLMQIVHHYIVLVGVTLPTIFLFVFDFKLTIFDFNNKEMLQTNYSIKGKRSLTLPFSIIHHIDKVKDKYFDVGGSYVRILTPKEEYYLTTISDASTLEQEQLIHKLKHSLSL